MTCPHRPVSNGFSGGGFLLDDGTWADLWPYSWCGRCRAFMHWDREWVEKFVERGRPPLDEKLAREIIDGIESGRFVRERAPS